MIGILVFAQLIQFRDILVFFSQIVIFKGKKYQNGYVVKLVKTSRCTVKYVEIFGYWIKITLS